MNSFQSSPVPPNKAASNPGGFAASGPGRSARRRGFSSARNCPASRPQLPRILPSSPGPTASPAWTGTSVARPSAWQSR